MDGMPEMGELGNCDSLDEKELSDWPGANREILL